MRYVIIAILLYFVYLFFKRVLKNVSNSQNKKTENTEKKENNSQKRIYDANMIQDAEFREVKKD